MTKKADNERIITISVKDSRTAAVGDYFILDSDPDTPYILAQTSDCKSVALINLVNGVQWCNPVIVKNIDEITAEELSDICNHVFITKCKVTIQ